MSDLDQPLLEDVLSRIATNVSMLVDREIGVQDVRTDRAHSRPAGEGQVHVSFRFRFSGDAAGDRPDREGCLLLPLPEAISLAGYLMMMSEDEVAAHRSDDTLDASTKDAMMELGNFIAAAVDESVKAAFGGVSVHAAGCQGVRADVRPAIAYTEGSELLIGRARARVHEWPEFELLAMFPVLDSVGEQHA